MRRLKVNVFAVLTLAVSACAPPKPVSAPPTARLAAADALVRAGCFDCLLSAFREYASLRSMASVKDVAAIGAARAAVLLAIRERELGVEDSGHLRHAQDIIAATPLAQSALGPLLDIADTLPVRGAVRLVADDVELRRNQAAFRNRDAWTQQLRTRANEDPLAAYLWLAFNCAYVPTAQHSVEQWLAAVPQWNQTPLLEFKAATCGSSPGRLVLDRLLKSDSRFSEIHYPLSFAFAVTGKIDEAMDHLLKAYAWRPRWPAVTYSLGVNYTTLEEFDSAVEFFDRTLAIVPEHPDALLGRAKALTYAGRFTESLDTLERLLASPTGSTGDARYWRALNELYLGRYDEAWQDVELAASLLHNAEVPKLAGVIAYRRQQLEVSREQFELAWQRNDTDCETGFYLGGVLAELGLWARSADVLVSTVSCFERAEVKLSEEIAAIRASTQPPERQARQIKKREDQIASDRRMVVTSRYNTAVGYVNLGRQDEARRLAERIADDEEFGERARGLLTRLRPKE
jgi:tetratricopeptide (TPR) repeat protein